MAIIGTDQGDDDQQTAQPQTGAAPGNVIGGGSGFVGGSGSGQGATTSKAPAPTSSGSYTNLVQYLGANPTAGASMGQGAENVVDTAGKAADTAINAWGTTGENKATVASDPTQVPGAADAQSAYQNLTGVLGNANGTQQGTAQLLRSAYNQPSYTAGENNLDAFLTNSNQGGQAALTQANTDWGNEGQKMTDTSNAITAAQAKPTPGPIQGRTPLMGQAPIVPGAIQGRTPLVISTPAQPLSSFGGPAVQTLNQPPAPAALPGSSGSSQASQASQAGAPIQAVPAYQGIVNALQQTAPTPTNINNEAKKLGF